VNSLAASPPTRRPAGRDNLFFALQPESAARVAIQSVADQLVERQLLGRRPVPPDCWHVTLLYIGRFDGVPSEVIEAACAVANRVDVAPFRLCLERLMSFDGRPGEHPLVLCPNEVPTPLRHLQAALAVHARRLGLVRRSGSFTPHLTLGREAVHLLPENIDPICWDARAFVLVHSLIGQGRHIVLRRWPA
jgi:RNA 2',3'-cyclic 3'-phosphodiesterase